MFYFGHRISKDIDIFVPDPQFLGYVNPRLGGPAEEMTDEYTDSATFVKLFFPEGEIDVVAAVPLTANAFAEHEVLGRKILLESPVEIVAKKLWYRGDRATPRDLLDLAYVIDRHYESILINRNVFIKNLDTFLAQCTSRRSIMLPAFDQIEKLDFSLDYDTCLERVAALKAALIP